MNFDTFVTLLYFLGPPRKSATDGAVGTVADDNLRKAAGLAMVSVALVYTWKKTR